MNRPVSGLSAWLVQRISAVYMLLFSLLAPLWWWLDDGVGYAGWHGLFDQLPFSLLGALFVIMLLLHAWVGMRDIILDYLGRQAALRLLLLSLLGIWLGVLGLWALRILTGVWA